MAASPRDNEETTLDEAAGAASATGLGDAERLGALPDLDAFAADVDDPDHAEDPGADEPDAADGGLDPETELDPEAQQPELEAQELRPQRKFRLWQLAPIVACGALGSLMFAFPLAFEPGSSGAVISMLGLLICGCAAGWGVIGGRRVGLRWPGMPARGSGQRPDWRLVAVYVVVVGAAVWLAVLRVARLR